MFGKYCDKSASGALIMMNITGTGYRAIVIISPAQFRILGANV
jgi:hypothetical protein